jgi:hypothetical protein
MEQRKTKNLVEAYIKGEINYVATIPLLRFNDEELGVKLDILTPEDITILFGPSGCGKSRISAFLVRQLLLRDSDKYFNRVENNKKYRVVFIDTEMSENNVVRYFLEDNFYEYESFHEANRDLTLIDRFKLYSFSSVSIEESYTSLREIAKEEEKYLNDYNIVFFIDNLGSFTEDLNSSTNNRLIKDLKAVLSKFTVLAVMHSNFKESSNNKNNATGALGSSAEKIGQTVLQVLPYIENGGIRLKLKKSKTQDDRKHVEVSFFYEEANGKVIFKNVSQKELLLNESLEQDKDKSKRIRDEELSNIILKYLQGKPLKSVDRLRGNLANAFPNIYKKSTLYPRIDTFVDQKVLKYENDYLFHKDESPF